MFTLPKIALGVLLPTTLMVLAQCGTSPSQGTAQTQSAVKPASIPTASSLQTTAPSVVPTPIVFDLDALYGISIDQLKAKLGKPIKDLQANVDGSLRECLYKKNGFFLIAGYVVASRKVDIISFVDEADKLSYQHLLVLGHADTTSLRYHVIPSTGSFTRERVGIAAVAIDSVESGQ